MIKEAMQYLMDIADAPTITDASGDREWVKGGYSEIHPPMPKGVELFTLTSLVEFIQMSEAHRGGAFVHVVSPTEVRLTGELTERQARKTYAAANPLLDGQYDIMSWLTQDVFVTQVQAFFEDKADRAKLLKIVGNIRKGDSQVLEDDGITQQVTTAAGVVSQKMEEMPNPVILHPWETFPEIENPERKYICRFRGGADNEKVTFRLFPVPDPRFSDMVCTEIKEWLRGQLPSDVLVLG